MIIKVLRTTEEFRSAKFAHEIQIYQVFSAYPPPVRVPRLVHTDFQTVLAVEHLPGSVIDTERYLARALSETALDVLLRAVTGFARWSPPAGGVLTPVLNYPDRVEREHRLGWLTRPGGYGCGRSIGHSESTAVIRQLSATQSARSVSM